MILVDICMRVSHIFFIISLMEDYAILKPFENFIPAHDPLASKVEKWHTGCSLNAYGLTLRCLLNNLLRISSLFFYSSI